MDRYGGGGGGEGGGGLNYQRNSKGSISHSFMSVLIAAKHSMDRYGRGEGGGGALNYQRKDLTQGTLWLRNTSSLMQDLPHDTYSDLWTTWPLTKHKSAVRALWSDRAKLQSDNIMQLRDSLTLALTMHKQGENPLLMSTQ